MLKKCANIACVIEFEPSCNAQKYCSSSCEKAVIRNTKKYSKAHSARVRNWIDKNPEKKKEYANKSAKKMYASGKLPRWMTDK